MEQAAAVVANQEEDIEGLEGQGLDHEQVCCPIAWAWLARKVRQLWLAAEPARGVVAADGAAADGDTGLEQLVAIRSVPVRRLKSIRVRRLARRRGASR